jgi:hypothetical protein
MPECKLAPAPITTIRSPAAAGRRERGLLRFGTVLAVLAAGQQAWAADCLEVEAAKPEAAVRTPATFYQSSRWYLDCRAIKKGDITSVGGGQPDCNPTDPAAKQFTDLLEQATDWYLLQDLQPLNIKRFNSDGQSKYFSMITRTDKYADTVENPAYYVKENDIIVFSAIDITCTARSQNKKDKATLARNIAHEMFHAYQAAAPFGSTFWKPRARALYGAWMFEGMPEAVGLAFAAVATESQPDFVRDTFYDIPLNETAPGYQPGYDRAHFWYRAAGKLGKFPVEVLRDITLAKEEGEVSESDPGFSFIDRMFRERGSSLREAYGRVIGENANIQEMYLSDGGDMPKLALEKPTTKEGLASDKMVVKRLAAKALLFNLTPSLLAPVKIDQPGIVVTSFTADLDRQKAAPHLGLAVSDQWLDEKPFERVFLNWGGNLGVLGRATNVKKADPNATNAEPVTFVATARQVRVAGPSCIGVGRTAEIVVEYLDGEGGEPPQLQFRARDQKGVFAGRNFTPSVTGQHVLQVEGYSGPSTKDWQTFTTVNVRSRACGVTMTMYEGGILSGRMVYDASSDATRMESPEGEVGFADAEGIVGRDDETGEWVRASNASTGGAAFGSALGYSLSGPGGPNAALGRVLPHRGPLTMAELYKEMRKSLVQAMGLRPQSVPCPTKGSGCVRYDVPDSEEAGTMALIFDRDGEPVLVGDPDGDRAEFTYEDDPVVVPAARRVN